MPRGNARGWPDPHLVRGGDRGRRPPGAAAAGAWAFSGRKPRRKSARGCGPWTPGVRGGGSSPHTPLLWVVKTWEGAVLSAEPACGPHSARLLRRAAHHLGGWHRWKGPFGWGRQRISCLCGQSRRWQNRRPAAPQRSDKKASQTSSARRRWNKIQCIFSTDMRRGKNTSQLPSVRALRARARRKLQLPNF